MKIFFCLFALAFIHAALCSSIYVIDEFLDVDQHSIVNGLLTKEIAPSLPEYTTFLYSCAIDSQRNIIYNMVEDGSGTLYIGRSLDTGKIIYESLYLPTYPDPSQPSFTWGPIEFGGVVIESVTGDILSIGYTANVNNGVTFGGLYLLRAHAKDGSWEFTKFSWNPSTSTYLGPFSGIIDPNSHNVFVYYDSNYVVLLNYDNPSDNSTSNVTVPEGYMPYQPVFDSTGTYVVDVSSVVGLWEIPSLKWVPLTLSGAAIPGVTSTFFDYSTNLYWFVGQETAAPYDFYTFTLSEQGVVTQMFNVTYYAAPHKQWYIAVIA